MKINNKLHTDSSSLVGSFRSNFVIARYRLPRFFFGEAIQSSFLNILLSVFLFSVFTSCEKEITVKLPKPETKIVIEGAIETGQHPWVFVTTNTPYFSHVDSIVIYNMIVKNAKVSVTDGTTTDSLQLTVDPYTFPFLKYVGSSIIGKTNKTYKLKVEVGGKVFTASTYIPNAVKIDSLKFKPDFNQDTLGYVWLYLKDPDTLGNYYRAFTKILGIDSVYLRPYPSVSDDRFFNGQKAEYSLQRGRNPLEDNKYDDNGLDSAGVSRFYFRKGQTVVVKLCSIDVEHYNFWFSIEQQFITDGNPFATPVSARSNISGGALGVWGGYGTYLDTLHIPK